MQFSMEDNRNVTEHLFVDSEEESRQESENSTIVSYTEGMEGWRGVLWHTTLVT